MKNPRSSAKSGASRRQIRRILVPIDFSKTSLLALPIAPLLAEKFGATVHLANVQDQFIPAGFLTPASPVPVLPISHREAVKRSALKRLEKLAAKNGVDGGCHVAIGAPAYAEISRIARWMKADLMVVPTHGRTGLKRVFLGSTAERLVQHSPCPVLVARREKSKPAAVAKPPGAGLAIRTIVVPVDFSDCSRTGLEYAIWFGGKFGASIIVLHVIAPVVTGDAITTYEISKYMEATQADAGEQMRRFVRKAARGPFSGKTTLLTGFATARICAFAKDMKADLIITATHGRTGFRHVLIGSTAESVVRHAHCPVLVVPSHPEARIQP